ncbi:MAG: hypothetical protein ACKPKO_07215, partial [Candidatus Fonsibacter sp.]
EEEPEEEEEEPIWDSVYDQWRNENQIWLMTYGGGPTGGYIIDYSSHPRVVSRWDSRSGILTITPLPDGVRLLYRGDPDETPEAHVHEFTVEEVESMEFEWLNITYATEWYELIWEDIPGEPPVTSDREQTSEREHTPGNFGIVPFVADEPYDGLNWQELEIHNTVTVTEQGSSVQTALIVSRHSPTGSALQSIGADIPYAPTVLTLQSTSDGTAAHFAAGAALHAVPVPLLSLTPT